MFFLLLLFVVPVLLVGCGKRDIPGYSPRLSYDGYGISIPEPEELKPGWGYVNVPCRRGVGRDRGQPDTLFGALHAAREDGTGVVRLPDGVYLGHVAEFIVSTLKFYHVEEHFEQLYGYRVVLLFRPATHKEVEARTTAPAKRMGAGIAGEAILTLAGGPLVPLIAPVLFGFEAVSEDIEFQKFRDHAKACGLPEPTRRGDAVAADRFGQRMDILLRDSKALEPLHYTIVACYLERPDARIRLVKNE